MNQSSLLTGGFQLGLEAVHRYFQIGFPFKVPLFFFNHRSYAVEYCFFFNRKVSQSKSQSSAKIYFKTLRNFAGTLRNFAVHFYDAEIPNA